MGLLKELLSKSSLKIKDWNACHKNTR